MSAFASISKARRKIPTSVIFAWVLSLAFSILVTVLVMERKDTMIIRSSTPYSPNSNRTLDPNIEGVTFITVPKPLPRGKGYANQSARIRLAISTWLSVSETSRVILYINKKDFDHSGKLTAALDRDYGSDRIRYLGNVRSDIYGVPYIDDWFIRGVADTDSAFVCFINSDIVIGDGWMRRAKQIFATDLPNKVVLGCRVDFDLSDFRKLDKLDYGSKKGKLLQQADDLVKSSKSERHSPYGIDTFLFRVDPPPFDVKMIQPFVMGRYNWDNWLTGYMTMMATTISMQYDPPVYHINHKRHQFDTNDGRVMINHHLRQVNGALFGSNYNTTWKVSKGVQIKNYFNKETINLPDININ